MQLFQLLKINVKSFPALTRPLMLLFTLTQLALWYPFLTKSQEQLAHHELRLLNSTKSLEALQKQSEKLATFDFLQEPWVDHDVISKGKYPTQLWLKGKASLVNWQTLIERMEESIGLSLFSVSWQRESGGVWFGNLKFDLIKPSENREYSNWLPVNPLNSFVPKHWTLVSTMQVNGKASALISYKNTQHWIYKGSWLPDVGISVENVSSEQVVLMTNGGDRLLLTMLNVGDADD